MKKIIVVYKWLYKKPNSPFARVFEKEAPYRFRLPVVGSGTRTQLPGGQLVGLTRIQLPGMDSSVNISQLEIANEVLRHDGEVLLLLHGGNPESYTDHRRVDLVTALEQTIQDQQRGIQLRSEIFSQGDGPVYHHLIDSGTARPWSNQRSCQPGGKNQPAIHLERGQWLGLKQQVFDTLWDHYYIHKQDQLRKDEEDFYNHLRSRISCSAMPSNDSPLKLLIRSFSQLRPGFRLQQASLDTIQRFQEVVDRFPGVASSSLDPDFTGYNCVVLILDQRQSDLPWGTIQEVLEYQGFRESRALNGGNSNSGQPPQGRSGPSRYCPHVCVVDHFHDRHRFLDGSIWHYTIPLQAKEGYDYRFLTYLEKTLDTIGSNWNDGLYSYNVSKEFLEFQWRMLWNSYVHDFGSGHSQKVRPFKFHSEFKLTRPEFHVEGKFHRLRLDFVRKLKWRFLLVDDFAILGLKTGGDHGLKSKGYFIEKHLEAMGFRKGTDYVLEVAETVDPTGLDRLSARSKGPVYDIILLDYLINRQEGGAPEYGTDLLATLREGKQKFRPGPLGFFWFFPVSSFSIALLDELKEKGIARFDKKWFLSDGADPVNTPELFKFKLVQFMHNLAEKAWKGKIKRLNPSNFDSRRPRSSAKEELLASYTTLIKLYDNYVNLSSIQEKSLFANSMIAAIHEEVVDEATFQHLIHLLYLIIFGNRLQSDQMWEVFHFLEKKAEFSLAIPSHDEEDKATGEDNWFELLLAQMEAEITRHQ